MSSYVEVRASDSARLRGAVSVVVRQYKSAAEHGVAQSGKTRGDARTGGEDSHVGA